MKLDEIRQLVDHFQAMGAGKVHLTYEGVTVEVTFDNRLTAEQWASMVGDAQAKQVVEDLTDPSLGDSEKKAAMRLLLASSA